MIKINCVSKLSKQLFEFSLKILNLFLFLKILYTYLTLIINSGKIDLEELIRAFKDLGIEMERAEARKLLQRYKILTTKKV